MGKLEAIIGLILLLTISFFCHKVVRVPVYFRPLAKLPPLLIHSKKFLALENMRN